MNRLDEAGQQRNGHGHEQRLKHLEEQAPAEAVDDDRESGLGPGAPFRGGDAGEAAARLVAVGSLHGVESDEAVARHRHPSAHIGGIFVDDEEQVLAWVVGVFE